MNETRLADAMGHMMADFVWWRPMSAAFKAINPVDAKYYTTRINRRQGFSSPVDNPLADLKLLLDWAFEWYCNFFEQIGQAVDEEVAKNCSRAGNST